MARLRYEHECSTHGVTNHRKTAVGYFVCLKCEVHKLTELRRNRRKKFVLGAGGKCNRCGYSKSYHALHFHHTDPSTKLFTVQNGTMTKAWATLAAEVEKCELICNNCHTFEHYGSGW